LIVKNARTAIVIAKKTTTALGSCTFMRFSL
jgi:hypothetical protein